MYQVIVDGINLGEQKRLLLYPQSVDEVFHTAKTADIFALGLDLSGRRLSCGHAPTVLTTKLLDAVAVDAAAA